MDRTPLPSHLVPRRRPSPRRGVGPALAALALAACLLPAAAQQTATAAPPPTPAGAAEPASPAAPGAAHRSWLGSAWHLFTHGGQSASDPPATAAAKGSGAAAAPAATSAPAPKPAAPPGPAKAAAPPVVTATPATATEYRLGAGDLLDVQVWHEPEISGKVPIRPDGKIAIPLAGEITAAGLTPGQLKTIITNKLRAFVSVPSVTVIVEQVNSRNYNVLGRVAHPGTYVLASRTRVLDALARAGGLSEFAHPNRIYILRANAAGEVQKLQFDYKHVIAGLDDAQDIVIQPGDTVVVP